MTRGRFIAVVGPSGAGKDSVMDGLCARLPALHRARRVITRKPEAGGEDYTAVTTETFERMQQGGAFALHWPAHGLHYGIPAEIETELSEGRDVIANLSRAVLPQAAARFSPFILLLVTASPQVLAQRLAARGREDQDSIARRLQRADFAIPGGLEPHVICNDGALDDAIDQALAVLQPASV